MSLDGSDREKVSKCQKCQGISGGAELRSETLISFFHFFETKIPEKVDTLSLETLTYPPEGSHPLR